MKVVETAPTREAPKLDWELRIGIHRGSLTSRDAEQPKFFSSFSEARDAADKAFKFYESIGCRCWYCFTVGPDKERIDLIEPEEYDIPVDQLTNNDSYLPAKRLKSLPKGIDPFDL